jgi:hypothetical protein
MRAADTANEPHEGCGGGGALEVDHHASDEIVTHGVFVKHLHLQAVIAFDDVETVPFVPIRRFAAAFVCFAAPSGADVEP